MAIQIDVSKLVGYAVESGGAAAVSKTVGYAALTDEAAHASKVIPYGLLSHGTVSVSKTAGFALLGTEAVWVSKAVAYALLEGTQAPEVNEAEIPTGGTTLVLHWSDVSAPVAGTGGLYVRTPSGPVTLSDYTWDGLKLTCTLSRTIYAGEVLSLWSFTPTGPLVPVTDANDAVVALGNLGGFPNNSTKAPTPTAGFGGSTLGMDLASGFGST